ncbi:MAG: DUF389 domain-containing protein [Deltaproteobacteria bacterium]|nr:DUF389 domain-containing protein [Deltaproteobacteria bacterium]
MPRGIGECPGMGTIQRIRNRLELFGKAMFFVSDLRKEQIVADITTGSDPRLNYYLLLLLSALIATFGLLADSPAVVIGAMLVSPLMTPIFGISLSLVTGETRLFRAALSAEMGGVFLVVAAGVAVGFSPLAMEVTPEILARTSPTLLDLFVATLAGLAGGLAMIDERISPVLPGVAIATALTPPLAACGLCLAFEAYEGAGNAFILFFANFLAILFVASVIFVLSGFVRGRVGDYTYLFVKRYALAGISLVFIVLFLTNALVRIIDHKVTTRHIRNAVLETLGHLPVLNVRDIVLDENRDSNGWLSLAIIDAPREPEPRDLRAIEDRLQERLGRPVNLIVRTHITRGVSSTGERLLHFYRTADGIEQMTLANSDTRTLNVVTQLLRDRIENLPNVTLADVELRKSGDGERVVHVTLQGNERLFPDGNAIMEDEVRRRLQDQNLRLVTHFIKSDTLGVEEFKPSEANPGQDDPVTLQLETAAAEMIQARTGLFPSSVKARFRDGQWSVLAEVSGRRLMTPEEVGDIEAELRQGLESALALQVFSKVEAMVDATTYRDGNAGQADIDPEPGP